MQRSDEPVMTDTPTIPLDGQLCYAIYSASLAIQRLYKPLLDQMGVTYTQYLVLSTLWEGEEQTVGAIAERLNLEPSTVTPAVKRLEAAGFVARRRSTTDERQVLVEATPKGRALRSDSACLTQKLQATLGLEAARMIELNQLVGDLTRRLNDHLARRGR